MSHDRPTTAIAEFASSLKSAGLSDAAVNSVVQHHLDAIACALGGFQKGPSKIARTMASCALSPKGSSVMGLADCVAYEQAVFANVTMVRQLDFNDSNPTGGHPSDFIPAIFAAGELVGATGRDVVRGIYAAYEVFCNLMDAYPVIEAGWDPSIFIGISTAVGAGTIFGLDFEQTANAIAIALVPSLPMLVTRHGALSNWKGCASAHSSMTGLFAARLAKEGLTGPAEPFEGEDGLHRPMPPRAELRIGELREGKSAIERCSFKYNPAQIHTQSVIGPLGKIFGQFDPDDLEKIVIQTHNLAWLMVGGGGGDRDQKWRPTSRETADHSLPFITAMSILEGDVTQDSYAQENLDSPKVHRLMDMTEVVKNDEFTALLPDEARMEITLTFKDGNEIVVPCGFPIGHVKNPMTKEQLSKKFHNMSKSAIDEKTATALEEVLWDLANVKDLNDITTYYRGI